MAVGDRKPERGGGHGLREGVSADCTTCPWADTTNHQFYAFRPESQALFQEWMTEIPNEVRSVRAFNGKSYPQDAGKTVASVALCSSGRGGRFEGTKLQASCARLGDYLRSTPTGCILRVDMAAGWAGLIVERRQQQLPESFTRRDIQRKGWASLGDRDAV